jgi:hypothetical protein
MRLINDRDQALLRSAVSDAAADLSIFIPSLSTREVFIFGEGVALPARLVFKELRHDLLPRREGHGSSATGIEATDDFLRLVLEQWRGAMTSGASQTEIAMTPPIYPYSDDVPDSWGGGDSPSAPRNPHLKAAF